MADVKTSRAARARATRRRILGAASALFVAQGYPATTMDQIAAEAGVAVQTLYYTFGTKGGLLVELVEVTAAGESDPAPVAERPWWREAMATSSPDRGLELAVEHGTAIYGRVAHLWPAVDAARATDPHVEEYWRRVSEAREAGQRELASHIAELGRLRPGLSVERAGDLVVLLVGHDVYRSLVLDAHWPVGDYRAWLHRTLRDQLLDDAAPV